MNGLRIHFKIFTAILLVSLCGSLPAYAGKIILTIPELRQLSVEEARRGLPVDIKAQVVYIHHKHKSCVIIDGEEGSYVRTSIDQSLLEGVAQGDLIRVQGIVSEGKFAPGILAHSVEVIDHKPMPDAPTLYPPLQMNPMVDCRWINMFGRLVKSTICEEGKSILVELEQHDRIFDLLVPYSEENEKHLAEIMFQVVYFNAVAGTVFNDRRQATGRILLVNSANDFKPNKQYNEIYDGRAEMIPVHELMGYGKAHRLLNETVGSIIYLDSNEMVIRGEEACLRVILPKPTSLGLGDKVAVVGFTVPGSISPSFRARSIEMLDKGEIPGAVRVELEERIDPSLNYELIEIDAVLVEHGKRFDASGMKQPTLLCRSGEHLFEARYPSGTSMEDTLVPGSTLRLTGICNVVRGTERRWILDVVGFRLQLRGSEDVSVLVPPPWWTPRRLLWGLGITFGSSLLFLIWVVALRKTVSIQTNLIGKQIEHETVLNERQRIAQELHDSLEQGLTGLSFLLNNLCSKLKKNPKLESELAAVETAERVLGLCREESRVTIKNLRMGLLEKMDLPAAIRQTLEPRLESATLELKINVMGSQRRLNLAVEHQLLRIITEATNNAINHASAKNIDIRLSYADDNLEVEICDDGCGFDPNEVDPSTHFGVSGMFERAKRLSGDLDIESEAGKGTRVLLSLPFTDLDKEG